MSGLGRILKNSIYNVEVIKEFKREKENKQKRRHRKSPKSLVTSTISGKQVKIKTCKRKANCSVVKSICIKCLTTRVYDDKICSICAASGIDIQELSERTK